jgi:hypothetical protein
MGYIEHITKKLLEETEEYKECNEGNKTCIDNDLYKCVNGRWQLVEQNSPKCTKPWLRVKKSKKPEWKQVKPRTRGTTLIEKGYKEIIVKEHDPFGYIKPQWKPISVNVWYVKEDIIDVR